VGSTVCLFWYVSRRGGEWVCWTEWSGVGFEGGYYGSGKDLVRDGEYAEYEWTEWSGEGGSGKGTYLFGDAFGDIVIHLESHFSFFMAMGRLLFSSG
jgi:hypothetical protein